MTDPLTTEIRRAVAELVDVAPLPPDLDAMAHHSAGRPRLGLFVVVGVVAATLIGGVFAFSRGSGRTTVAVRQPAPGPQELAGSVPAATDGGVPPEPTLVSPASPPAGLRFIEGGRTRLTNGPSEIVIAGPSGRAARLIWGPADGCPNGGPVTTVRSGTKPASSPNPKSAPLASSPNGALFEPSSGGGTLRWCENKNVIVNLFTTGFEETAARALAATVQVAPGHPDVFTLIPPSGFAAGRPSTGGTAYTLAFRPNQTTTSRPQMTILIQSAWTTDVSLLEAEVGISPATEVNVGGRPGFVGQMSGGPRYQSLTLVYDSRTILTVQGDGLSPQQLLSAAASLTSADPSLAPDVGGDPQRCVRLGLCG